VTWAPSPEHIQIGALGWGSQTGTGGYKHVLDGEIRDLAIYDKILSEADVAALAATVAPQDPQPAPEPTEGETEAPLQDPPPAPEPEPEPEQEPTQEQEQPAEPEPEPSAPAVVYELSGKTAFDARDSVINLPGDDFLQLEETTITLAFTADNLDTRQGLLSRDAANYSGDGNHLSIYIEGDALKVRMQDGEKDLVLTHKGVQPGTEYHVGVSFGDGEGRLLVNGEVADSGQTDLTWATSPEHIQIGALGWGSQTGTGSYKHVLDGEIRDLAIYDKILSEADVAAVAATVAPQDPQPAT